MEGLFRRIARDRGARLFCGTAEHTEHSARARRVMSSINKPRRFRFLIGMVFVMPWHGRRTDVPRLLINVPLLQAFFCIA
jgi:hypothetical protein